MDVVKSTFEKLGGAIDLETNLGSGTKVIIHLPTTLTIMSSLIVRIEGDRYAVPHSELKEVILVRPEDEVQIEKIRDREVYRLRGNLIPILSMDEITGVTREGTKQRSKSSGEGEVLFLVLHSGLNLFGLLIDSIDHTEEIVVKPLAQILSSHTFYAGSSILGDSDVAMVLSANGICQSHKLHIHDLETSVQSTKSLAEMQILDMQEKQDLLVFRYSRNEQLAIPLSLVLKLNKSKLGKSKRFPIIILSILREKYSSSLFGQVFDTGTSAGRFGNFLYHYSKNQGFRSWHRCLVDRRVCSYPT